MGALSDLSRAYFGGPTRSRVRDVTVNTTVTALLPENPDRLAWAIQNRSANFGAYDHGNGVLSTTGFRLNGPDGAAAKDYRTDGESCGYAVFAINDTAGGTWHVEEIIRSEREGEPLLARL